MSHSEQAVNHAIVALGALHEDLEVRGAPLSRENLKNRYHRFALEQNGRSLVILNQRRHSQDPKLRDVILTCCLLFVAFDLLRGHYDPALMHLQKGLEIIEESRLASASSSEVSPCMDAVERSLLATLTRLATQSVFFGFNPPASADTPFELDKVCFHTLLEARRALDHALARVMSFCKAADEIPVEDRLPDRHPELAVKQGMIKMELEEFSTRLAQSEALFLRPQSIKERRGLDLIYLHYITFKIFLETVLIGESQSIYESYFNQFAQLLALSKRVSNSFLEESDFRSRPTLLFDMGITPSLFLICWKCHDLALRQQALELLEEWPHREGLFDSRLLVIFARQLIQLDVEFLHSSSGEKKTLLVLDPSFQVSEDQTYATLRYQSREPGQEASAHARVIPLDDNS